MRSQVILAASMAVNATLFAANLAVAIPSGSRAVLSQAIFSVTDLLAAALLWWGFHASQRPPTPSHPFGFGKERFFWAFLASMVSFPIAGALVLASGIERILSPQSVLDPQSGVLVVGFSLLASAIGIAVAWGELRRSRESIGTLMQSAHVGVKTVVYQDIVALAGSAVAFAGIAAVASGAGAIADGLSAAVVGILLIGAGVVVSAESRELLIGRSIPPDLARRILSFVERDPRILTVRSLQSMMLGPDDALVALRVNFIDGLTTDLLEREIDMLGAALRAEFPSLRHIIIEPES
ncbi:MAG: cation diffusion facilitator family transporter [Thermoplasmata archaeon]